MFTEHCGRVRATSTASRLQNRASEMFETKAGLRPRIDFDWDRAGVRGRSYVCVRNNRHPRCFSNIPRSVLVLTDTFFFFGVRRRRGDLYVCNECVRKARRIAQCRRKVGKCCAEKLRLPQKVIKPYTVRCCSAYVFLFLSFSIFPLLFC